MLKKYIKPFHIMTLQIILLLFLLLSAASKFYPVNADSKKNQASDSDHSSSSQASDSDITDSTEDSSSSDDEKDFIKWVDFNVTSEAMKDAYTYDWETYGQEIHLNWIELLAYLGAKYGGDFSSYKRSDMKAAADAILSADETMESLTKTMNYYDYYLEAYGAVLNGLVGEYEIELPDESSDTGKVWSRQYGLKGFLPIAKGFEYQHYDDFGVSRSYGYQRNHLGHDMMGQVGTPIVAIESGYVEAMGWNQYGGWRIGIRSFDGLRYYYYAHLRKNFPYALDLEEGSVVKAGDVIGYMGRTGYSATENTNNIEVSHLHWGLQLIFDESQKEGNNEIWVDCYELSKFLAQNQSLTSKNQETKEWTRIYDFQEQSILDFK